MKKEEELVVKAKAERAAQPGSEPGLRGAGKIDNPALSISLGLASKSQVGARALPLPPLRPGARTCLV